VDRGCPVAPTLASKVRCLLPARAQDRKRILSFVIVGGGPTGVEVAAELHDMIFDDFV
jgi:NADH dehydrogenase FAD-containing subunit